MVDEETGNTKNGGVSEIAAVVVQPDEEGLMQPPADETTALLEVSSTSSSVTAAAGEDEANSILWKELESPWPSTFERSISLLASPILPKTQAALYTKSPKPGSTPLALQHRRNNLDRGVHSPEPSAMAFARRSDSERGMNDDFRPGDGKLQSLDFWKNRASIQGMQAEQEKRMARAQEYRKKILQKADVEITTASGGTIPKKKLPPKVHAKATFVQCAFNLANILMGVGLLGLPFVFKAAGWYGGLVCILSFAIVTWRTSILIGRELNGDPRPSSFFVDSPFKSPLRPGMTPAARMLPPITSFPDIARNAFGEIGCFILSAILYFELFSCIAIFLVSMGDHLHELFPNTSSTNHSIIAAAVSLIPTIILRTPALLSYFSMVGTFATLAVVISVIASAVGEGDIAERVAESKHLENASPYHVGWRTEGLALALGVVAYCFSGHAIVPSIYTSMEKPQEFEKMVTMAFFVVTVASLAVGVSGYYMFGSTVLDQVTLSLEQSSRAILAMKALTWLMILTGVKNN
jgi:vesicular inhibitory amino acid transporter